MKVNVKDGVITCIESDDLINPNMPMEDKYISEKAIMNGLVQIRTWSRDIGLRGFLYHPNRVCSPMKRVSPDRGT